MNWFRVKAFIRYYIKAITKFNTHSPFLYDFVSTILDTDKNYYAFENIEARRKVLLNSNNKLEIKDLGAGSQTYTSNIKTVSEIAKSSLSPVNKCRIMFNIILHYKCNTILELGTSLGISSSYFASTSALNHVITLEGDEKIAALAKNTHHSLGLKNIEIHTGRFDETLPIIMNKVHKLDFIFFDGHHLEQPTLHYFDTVIKKCDENSIIILDDIYWSEGMLKAWDTIKKKPEATLTIDLFDIGIVFLNKKLTKENITYIPYHYKPWKIGLFG